MAKDLYFRILNEVAWDGAESLLDKSSCISNMSWILQIFCMNLDFLKKYLQMVQNRVIKMHENGFEIHFSVKF